jgi:hypothetical protein
MFNLETQIYQFQDDLNVIFGVSKKLIYKTYMNF